MGHNLCLDLFGGSIAARRGPRVIPLHGEASVVAYEISDSDGGLVAEAHLPLAQLRVKRSIALHGRHVRIQEMVENLACFDRPIGWTEHVTLGAPVSRSRD